jgi:hypothetical protein
MCSSMHVSLGAAVYVLQQCHSMHDVYCTVLYVKSVSSLHPHGASEAIWAYAWQAGCMLCSELDVLKHNGCAFRE